MNRYLPPCCRVAATNAGYEIQHTETADECRHTPSGGTGGYQDGRTRCNRIIGHGSTRAAAITQARAVLGLAVD